MNSGREWRIIMRQEMTEQGDKERRGQGSGLTVNSLRFWKPETGGMAHRQESPRFYNSHLRTFSSRSHVPACLCEGTHADRRGNA